ncbi:hypothetical protein ACSQ67_008888 [Phaseolus vulgaris]
MTLWRIVVKTLLVLLLFTPLHNRRRRQTRSFVSLHTPAIHVIRTRALMSPHRDHTLKLLHLSSIQAPLTSTFFHCAPLRARTPFEKIVLKVELYDDKIKKKAMKTVSGISGVESVSVDMKDQKMTVTGDVDSVKVAIKLKKFCHADILSVGPAKEEKKPDPRKHLKTKIKRRIMLKLSRCMKITFTNLDSNHIHITITKQWKRIQMGVLFAKYWNIMEFNG